MNRTTSYKATATPIPHQAPTPPSSPTNPISRLAKQKLAYQSPFPDLAWRKNLGFSTEGTLQPFEQTILDCCKSKNPELKLNDCELTSIPECIKKLTFLENIQLQNNPITSIEEVEKFLSNLENLRQLKAVDLSNTPVASVKARQIPSHVYQVDGCFFMGRKNLVSALSYDQCREFLEFPSNLQLHEQKILDCFRSGSFSLDLSNCNVETLPSCLRHFYWVKEIILYCNKIFDLSSLALLPNLKSLDLRYTLITNRDQVPNIPTSCSVIFSDSESSRPLPIRIQKSFLDSVRSSNEVTIRKFLGFPTEGTLQPFEQKILDCFKSGEKQLNLSRCGLRSVPECLKKLSWLEELDLSSNSIDDIGLLRKLPELSILKLNDNEISDITPLQDLSKLKFLDLRYTLVIDREVFRDFSAKSCAIFLNNDPDAMDCDLLPINRSS